MAVSRDRGQTFDKAVTITPPSQVGPGATYVYPEIDAAGNVYVAVVSFPANGGTSSTIYVARSSDDARTFGPFVPVAPVTSIPTANLPNTRFRDGITESFAASPTYANHLYLTYEDWDPLLGQMDVKFTQSTDGGQHWSTPVIVNDNVDMPGAPTDQFQPSVAAGPSGAVAVAFYDRANRARTTRACSRRRRTANFCIDTSLQPYKDSGGGARAGRRRTSGSRSSPGIRSSRDSISAASRSTRAPVPGIRARAAPASSATTSGSQSPPPTSTRSWSRPTTPRTSPQTKAARSTTNSRCSRRCRAPTSAAGY